ncbi:23S rRNA (uracil(1939)-C(5))-methyltransferase RlmD [Caldanaerobius polysaccharolyticus]|uniref:23S rRNA (uracil(1939)-C(5))-methyltransferase RlmD n=1 Tax=Caldanaerobius polysaccharolyticus TaxID=44256 RepID=UPI00047B865A|nr:23S rRNA (uracil(1939)-C(5))-methyltransferase RlmD [Caldanaerobius polysaccharolyticus]
MKKGQELVLDVVDVEYPGYGVGYVEGFKVKVKGAVKGQRVRAAVNRIKGKTVEARAVSVIQRSPYEREGICPAFGSCGGCMYLNVSYQEQLKIKEDMVKKLLDGAGIKQFDFLGIKESPRENGYRNKMEFTFGRDAEGQLTLGMHKRARFYEVVPLNECMLVDQDYVEILKCALEYGRDNHLPYYDSRTHSGYMRHLVVRKALKTGEILVNLVTTTQLSADLSEFADRVKKLRLNGNVVGILHTYNDKLSDAVICEKLEVLCGRDYIVEELLGLKFKISPFSFFQTNTYGAEALYSIVKDLAGDLSGKVVFDLYCGTGTIGIVMAPWARKVIGVEIVNEAVEAAYENARLNGLDNCVFYAADVAEALTRIQDSPDIVVVDPPRSGVSPKAIDDICGFSPEKIVYVSCNPESMVRDLRILEEKGYKVKKVKCMDMFPHTPHVECVTLMSRV